MSFVNGGLPRKLNKLQIFIEIQLKNTKQYKVDTFKVAKAPMTLFSWKNAVIADFKACGISS